MSWLPKEQWLPANPPIRSSEGARSVLMLEEVIQQFGVGTHQRYQPIPARAAIPGTATTPALPARAMVTYCKTFAEDVSIAMNVVFPHWVDSIAGGNPAPVGHGAVELNINSGIDWLHDHGCIRYGWKPALEADARQAAGRGELAIAVVKEAVHGHIAVLRPPRHGDSPDKTWIAQAGAGCFDYGPIEKGFGIVLRPQFWVRQ